MTAKRTQKKPARRPASKNKPKRPASALPFGEEWPIPMPNTGSEALPPGATAAAADRPIHKGGGPPGSGAGPRHAADDVGSPDEEYGAVDTNDPRAEPLPPPLDPLEQGPPYAGISGGAVGGSPAEGRAVGGTIEGGYDPGSSHRGDSTLGSITSTKKSRPRKATKEK